MPEGPEIRREADAIAAVLIDAPLTTVYFEPAALKPYEDLLCGCRVRAIDTRGKALLTHFDNGLTLYSHNQLYGRWVVRPPGGEPPGRRTLRVGLHTPKGSALLLSATEVRLCTAEELAAHPFLCKLGPDVLDPALDRETVAGRLNSSRFRRRALGGLYLDQAFVAGIGNYLRSEILHFAGLRAERTPATLTADELQALAQATLEVSWRAYRARGVTNLPAQVAALTTKGLRYSAFRFAVFDRAGEACYTCGATIGRAEVNGRRWYYCPQCQR